MNSWNRVWNRITDAARHNTPSPTSEMADGFADSVLDEVKRRKQHVRLSDNRLSDNRLSLVISLISTAAALGVVIWCWDAVQWYADSPPVVLHDIIDLEPTP